MNEQNQNTAPASPPPNSQLSTRSSRLARNLLLSSASKASLQILSTDFQSRKWHTSYFSFDMSNEGFEYFTAGEMRRRITLEKKTTCFRIVSYTPS